MYNFTYLDEFLDILWKLNLKPGFELMGNPGQLFSNFEDPKQVYAFKDLVKTIAERYIGMSNSKYSVFKEKTWLFNSLM